MEKEKVIEELIKIVSESLESDTDGLEGAVDLATNFSIENSISPDSLIKLSCSCGFNKLYSLAYVFSKSCAIISAENINKANAHYNAGVASFLMGRKDEAEKQYLLSLKAYPKSVSTHLCYGNLLRELGRTKEAENQYLLALKIDPNNVNVHSNYGTLLQELKRTKKAEIHYLLALKFNPNDAIVHYNYGNLLRELDRIEEAEIQYKIATKLNPENVDIYYNYGHLLKDIRREKEAETQYKRAIELNPKHVSAHYNYGNLLRDMGREKEAEIEYQHAIKLDPENPNHQAGYSLFLLSMNLEEKAIGRANIASRLFKEKGNITEGHHITAYVYENLTNRYYSLKKYQESGRYAEISGNEYIEAGKNTSEEIDKAHFLTKGYALKAKVKIRDLDLNDIQPPYNEEIFAEIIKGIYYASKYYKKAAEESPENDPICNACSLSMKCLSEMLNCMLVLIEPKPKKIPIIKDETKKWNEELANCKKMYNGYEKGDNLIVSLYKIISCIEKLAIYKETATVLDKITLEDHIQELIEIANKIEGPLQKIIETSAKQMDCYMSNRILHKSIGTEFSPEIDKNQEFEFKDMAENIYSKNISEITSRNQAVILTAIPEEYDAVRSHLTNLKEEQCKGTIYEIGQFVTESNVLLNIAIVEIGMHNPNAALEAERASEYFKPNVIFFVGVAGGIKDVNIGDVVAVTKAYGYEYGKETESFKTRPEAPESTYDLIHRARAVARNKKWVDRIDGEYEQLPKAFVGPIASGEKVLASTQSKTYELIRSSYNDALAVDMESVGFLRATHANRELMSIVIRGISDLLNGKSESDREGSQELASKNAAAFAFELISQHNFNKESNN